MSKKKTDFKVPYKGGRLQQYAYANSFAHPEYGREGEEWRDNEPFQARMVISSMYSGRSAKGIIWTDTKTGYDYPMFVSDLIELLKTADVIGGEVYGYWVIAKRGQNYGIRFYEAI